jgi:hypothetical protein
VPVENIEELSVDLGLLLERLVADWRTTSAAIESAAICAGRRDIQLTDGDFEAERLVVLDGLFDVGNIGVEVPVALNADAFDRRTLLIES